MFGSHMNPQRGRHMSEGGEQRPEDGNKKPDIFVQSHSGGHTVHVFHKDGRHEMREHGHDAGSVADHVHEALGGNNEAEMHEDNAGSGAVTE
jgi:hypothetical protein